MAMLDLPNAGLWYRLANSETFRVLSVNAHDDEILIQYSDGGQEVLDLDTWNMLEAHPTEVSDDDFEDDELEEIDFEELGVAPGTEAVDHDLILSDDSWY